MNAAPDSSKHLPLLDFVNLRCGEMQTAPYGRARTQGKIAEGDAKREKRWVRMASPPLRTPFPQICVVLVTI
jgi:hypothetical protein